MVLSASWGVLTVGLLAEQLQQQREWLRVPRVWRLAGWFAQVELVLRFEELPAGVGRQRSRMPRSGAAPIPSQTSGTPPRGQQAKVPILQEVPAPKLSHSLHNSTWAS